MKKQELEGFGRIGRIGIGRCRIGRWGGMPSKAAEGLGDVCFVQGRAVWENLPLGVAVGYGYC